MTSAPTHSQAASGELSERFSEFLTVAGADLLPPTNEYELARFKTVNGVCVAYRNKKGAVSFSNDHARAAWEAFVADKKWLASAMHKRAPRQNVEAKLRKRDGDGCFFCDLPFTEEAPPTLEHLLSIAHGGNNHLSNLVLAHGECNLKADSMPVIEKVKLRDVLRVGAA